MKRVVVLFVIVATVLAPLAGVVGGLSSPDTTSDDLDIFFVDASENLKYTDTNGNVVDTGARAVDVGGKGDIDGDGRLEVAYVDSGGDADPATGYLRLLDQDGSTTGVGANADLVGGMADFDDDGRIEVAYVEEGNLYAAEDDGLDFQFGQSSVGHVGGTDDVDDDGLVEVAFVEGDVLRIADANQNAENIAGGLNNPVEGAGGIADMDDDGTVEIAAVISNTLTMVEPDGTETSTGLSVGFQLVGGVGDLDADGDEDAVYLDASDETINFASQDGQNTDLGVNADTTGDVGAVVDWDEDGFARDDPPTVSNPSPDNTTVSTDPVTLSVDVDDPELAVGDEVQVDIDHDGTDIKQTNITSAQTVTADIQDVQEGSHSWSVTVTDAGGNSNSYSYSYTADYAAPQLSNPQPTGNATAYGGDVSVDLIDGDFDNSADDVVTVAASEGGNQIGSKKVSGNGTVSFDYNVVTGSQTVNWTATDSHGNSDSLSQQFTVESDLIIRNETNTSQLVASPTVVEATFFGDNTTVTKSDDDGTISFDGLPADQPFIVEVSADGYRDRTVYVPSLLQQQTVYLLPENASAVQVRFTLRDASGTFSEQSVLYIEKPINDSGNVSYQIIASDRFGAAGVTTFLEKNVRYDLRVVSERGDVAQIGAYGAAVNETVVLEPSVASIRDPDDSSTIQYEAAYRNATQEIVIEYVDPASQTDAVTVRVVKQDGTVIKPNQTYYSSQTLSLSVPTNGQLNQTAYVYLNGTRGNETFNASVAVGPQQQDVVPDAADSVWVQIGAGAVILMVGGVFSALNVGVGAAITSLFAGVLWWLGIMSGLASGAAIGLAIGLSTLNLLLKR
jgi:hypothetical protein